MSETCPSTLPHDLILAEILPKVPAKSVGKFKCVAKPWKRDLSTYKFAKAHFNFHKENQPEDLIFSTYFPHILFGAESGSDAIYRDVDYPFEGSVDVVGSCNGLILLLGDSNLLLINPLTSEALKIPDCPNLGIGSSASAAYGLGSESSEIGLLKIVAISSAEKGRFADIFTVKEKSWKRVEFPTDPYVYIPDYNNGMFFNGCVHWKSIKNVPQGSNITDPEGIVIAFNLEREEFAEVPLPEDNVEPYSFEIMVVEGCLSLIDNHLNSPTIVWVMREYGVRSSWSILAMVDDCVPMKLVYQLNTNEFVFVKNNELQVYNWRDGVWRNMVVADAPQSLAARISFATSTATFKNSLISPN